MDIRCPLCKQWMYNSKAIYNQRTRETEYEFKCYDDKATFIFYRRVKGIDEY